MIYTKIGDELPKATNTTTVAFQTAEEKTHTTAHFVEHLGSTSHLLDQDLIQETDKISTESKDDTALKEKETDQEKTPSTTRKEFDSERTRPLPTKSRRPEESPIVTFKPPNDTLVAADSTVNEGTEKDDEAKRDATYLKDGSKPPGSSTSTSLNWPHLLVGESLSVNLTSDWKEYTEKLGTNPSDATMTYFLKKFIIKHRLMEYIDEHHQIFSWCAVILKKAPFNTTVSQLHPRVARIVSSVLRLIYAPRLELFKELIIKQYEQEQKEKEKQKPVVKKKIMRSIKTQTDIGSANPIDIKPD